ncbi:MAG TPA: NAD(P)H-dependent glycerol-3-phosphate dehydrogenase [Thermoanaerobaculia bacterium]|jgi:glycerol-3-phosphate dehydrogenase (NAD(P)+)|nr:NAD(P)H-dependent glycerol-3-phosphate dehydrogenase [Thermoanaerobaculia bacterium]
MANRARQRIGVLGAGSWGTALAVHFAGVGGHQVALWARNQELAARMAGERVNADYLPGVTLPERLVPTAEMGDLLGCELVLLVVPSHGFRKVLRDFLALHPGDRPVQLVSGTKGIEADTLARMSQVTFEEAIAADREVRFAVLCGPSFAAEVARNVPTAAVIASEDGDYATGIRESLSTPLMRLYSSHDVVGAELGSTAKNVIAIAAGTALGLGFGQNTLAALITRGLHEITRLGIAYGGQARTFAGLAGLGDLVLTCTGGLSRNRRTGLELAQGKTLAEITGSTTMVAEGIRNSLAVAKLAAQRGVEMPITRQMVAILYEGKDPRQAVEELMTRELKDETEL